MVAMHIDRVGGGGTAYRYGGEEFSVVFPGADLEDCEPHLEQVRRAVGRYRLALRDVKGREVPEKVGKQRRGRRKHPRENSVSVTISIGVAERTDRTPTPEDVIKAADEALYRAKEKGRNCLSR
jgi:GGDEF domain-containing protein